MDSNSNKCRIRISKNKWRKKLRYNNKQKATTKTGTNLVQSGEEIIYTLEIKNNGKEDFKGIEVSDSIPENTTYVETEDNSVKIKENDQVIGLKWYIDIKAGETVGVQFTVKVNEQAKEQFQI